MDPHSAGWILFSRLGEAQILLPAMAAAVLWLARTPRTRPLALAWVLATTGAALITTASKVAFIGWEVGYAALDYTGISGHSMFAGVVLPVLARIAAGRSARPWPQLAIGVGYLLAAGIAVSRVETGAHSVVESVLGVVLGGGAAALALRRTRAPDTPTPGWLAVGLLVWLLALPLQAPPSRTHDWVTQLSLRASGRGLPYTRHAMHRHAMQPVKRPAPPSGRTGPGGAGWPTGQLQPEPV